MACCAYRPDCWKGSKFEPPWEQRSSRSEEGEEKKKEEKERGAERERSRCKKNGRVVGGQVMLQFREREGGWQRQHNAVAGKMAEV